MYSHITDTIPVSLILVGLHESESNKLLTAMKMVFLDFKSLQLASNFYFHVRVITLFVLVGAGSAYSQIDITPPVIECPSDTVLVNDPGSDGAMVQYEIPRGTDNLPGAVTTRITGIGQTTVLYFEYLFGGTTTIPRSVYATDLDNDGDADALFAASVGDQVGWYENMGGGVFGSQQLISTNADGARSVFAIDLDGDGFADVLSASLVDNKIAWYPNTGSGGFGTEQVISTNADEANSVFAIDLDGDGDADVLSASMQDDKIAWYENLGSGVFGPQQVITTIADGAASVYATDLDGDGDEDVLSASILDGKIAWYENLGSGSFGSQQIITNAADGALSVFSIDLDGDGDSDVLSASAGSSGLPIDNTVAWYENLGSGIFGPQQVIRTWDFGAQSVYAADLDGDGDAEVLVSTLGSKSAWFENLGGGSFGPAQGTAFFTGGRSIYATDMDEDGDEDVFIAGGALEWYKNTKLGAFFPVGVTSETYLATDAAGNTDTCSFTVTVQDIEAPIIICPADTVVGVTIGSGGGFVSYTPPIGVDNVPGATTTLIAGIGSGGFFPLGLNTESYLVTDAEGYTNNCSFTISVIEDLPPTITCPNDTAIGIVFGASGANVSYSAPLVSDDLPGAITTLLAGLGSGNIFPIGLNTETYLVTDVLGNTDSCSFSILIVEDSLPEILCPMDTVVSVDPGNSGAVVTYALPIGTDNLPGAITTLLSGVGSGNFFPVGTSTEVYLVTDTLGLTNTCAFTVSVIDDDPPQIICPSDTQLFIPNPAWGGLLISYQQPISTDNLVGVTTTLISGIGQKSEFGTQQVIGAPVDAPLTVFATDLDGDGDMDILTASANDDKIVWFENLGGGGFGPQQVISTAIDRPNSVFATDLDGDGDSDVISASQNDDKIAWFENLGGGSFSLQHVISTDANSARSVYATDMDGDGDMDVLAASFDDDKIAWYKNLGNGNFGPQQLISIDADGAMSVFAADLDNDGDPDVLSASFYDDKIAWYENMGSSGAGPQQVISTATAGARSIFASDLDGDGNIDVISASSTDDKVAWYKNLGGGSFGPQQVISTSTDNVYSIYAVDLDGDGDSDVVSASTNDDKIAWFENLGAGVFGPEQVISILADFPTCVYAADLDDDGDIDVLSSSSSDDKIAWYEQTKSGRFFPIGTNVESYVVTDAAGNSDTCSFSVTIDIELNPPVISCPADTVLTADSGSSGEIVTYPAPFATDNEAGTYITLIDGIGQQTAFGTQQEFMTNIRGSYTIHAADLDSDGDLDVVSAGAINDKIAWFENIGNGVFESQQVISLSADAPSSVYAADLDNDGDADLLCGSSGDAKIAWYENMGGGNFGLEQIINTTASGARSVYAADLDGDGDLDVLSASTSNDRIAWYENFGDGTFGPMQLISNTAQNPYSVFAIDLDGDGDIDVLNASQGNNRILWYENMGGGMFGSPLIITSSAQGTKSVYAIDLDGDGDPDVLSASIYDDKIAWYENMGGGSFGPQQIISTLADRAQNVFAIDIDGDGDADVLSASSNDDKIAWYENMGSGSFGPEQVISNLADGAQSIYAADLDGDGDADVLSTSDIDHKLAWYENTKSGKFFPIGTNTETYIATDVLGLTDTCSFTVTVVGDLCTTAIAPQNPTHGVLGSLAQLSWDTIPASVACQIEGTRIVPPGPTASRKILGFEVSSTIVPLSVFGAGTTWIWRTQCACSITPLDVSAFSTYDTITVPTSYRESALVQNVRLFPNPASTVLNIDLEGYEGETVEMSVTAVDGRAMILQHRNINVNWESIELDVSLLTAGIYTVGITSSSGRVTTRFFKEE